jgi:hypothetical protein
LCNADEIRIDREGYCATYEEIPEEVVDEMDLPVRVEDLTWEEEEEEDELEVEELGEEEWEDLEEEEEEEAEEEEEEEEEEEGLDDENDWSK